MKFRDASFFYLTGSFVSDYRKRIVDYLKEKEEDLKDIGMPQLIVDLHDGNIRENRDPTGHLYIHDIENNSNKFEDICNYILSKERKFIPLVVACRDKQDYSLIEKVLKDNYGDKGKLTTGMLGIGLLVNERRIKRE
jgi:hypothetical protein